MPRRRRKVTGQQVVVASAARTTTGNSSAFQGWARLGSAAGNPQQRLSITAVGGTPNLVLTLEDSPNGSTWTTRDTFPAQTGVATVTRALPAGLDVWQRYVWTITGGTTSLTFSVQIAASTDSLV
jgi:hypothetical protein